MKKNILALTACLLVNSPFAWSGFLFIDPPPEPTPTTPPVEVVPKPQAHNDFISLVMGVQVSVSGNVMTNDANSDRVAIRSNPAGSGGATNSRLIGKYGSLELKSAGEFTYTLFQEKTVTPEAVVKEIFYYSAFNKNNEKSDAQLTIEIISKLNSNPTAVNDTASIVIGIQTSATGNVISNDFNTKGVTINGSLIGQYGALELKNTGEYTYTLFPDIDALIKNKNATVFLESFDYTAYNATNQQAIAKLVIQLISKISPSQATSTQAIARDDSVIIRANSTLATVTGNAISNDDSSTGNDTKTTTTGKKSVQLNSAVNSPYGFLGLNVDGTFIYTLYNGAPSVITLKFGDTFTDSFAYTYLDEFGQSANAKIKVTIIGNPVDSAGNTLFNTANSEAPADSFTIRDTGGENIPVVTGAVTNRTTENNNKSYQLTSASSSKNGFLIFGSDGRFTYTLYRKAPAVLVLKLGEVLTDRFVYRYLDKTGRQVTATLNIAIIGNPLDAAGNTIFETPNANSAFDNVDIEFNDRSAQATPLNSSKNIRGHLHSLRDKDWYSLSSVGNEVITLEMCPRGSACFGQKNWVLYVFDGQLITPEMEQKSIIFKRYLKETGSRNDLSGQSRISGISSAGESNHMYLAYRSGFFDDALIGVVDPCFDKTNLVNIGVDKTPKNYLFVISTPLKGTGNTDGDLGCGAGSVVLTRDGVSVSGVDAATPPVAKLYETAEEYISAFPYSDDQYTVKVTGTGLNPLLAKQAEISSASFNSATGRLIIPKINVLNKLYKAELSLNESTKTNTEQTALTFALNTFTLLVSNDGIKTYQATYDPKNQRVIIPRVTNVTDGKAYSIIMQYIPEANGQPVLLKVVSIVLIK